MASVGTPLTKRRIVSETVELTQQEASELLHRLGLAMQKARSNSTGLDHDLEMMIELAPWLLGEGGE